MAVGQINRDQAIAKNLFPCAWQPHRASRQIPIRRFVCEMGKFKGHRLIKPIPYLVGFQLSDRPLLLRFDRHYCIPIAK